VLLALSVHFLLNTSLLLVVEVAKLLLVVEVLVDTGHRLLVNLQEEAHQQNQL
jgi:hypothetical protein